MTITTKCALLFFGPPCISCFHQEVETALRLYSAYTPKLFTWYTRNSMKIDVYSSCRLIFLLMMITGDIYQYNLYIQYIPRNMHTVFALLCFVVVIHWLIFPYPSGLLHWHCGNLTIAPVPAKQPWWIWINTPYEFIMNDCITTTKQSTTKPCAYFLGYTVYARVYQRREKHCVLAILYICDYIHIYINLYFVDDLKNSAFGDVENEKVMMTHIV